MISSSSASVHIIAVISKNVTATQAETILTMLTHNSTGGRIGNNVTISSTALYLLHLPNDILSAIPTSVMNSGMGEGPNYYSLGSIISDIANMVFDFLVWVATGGVLLLLAHLVKEGLKAISNLVSTAISAVEAAVDRIVDAFCAMVDWVVEQVTNVFNALIAPLVDYISNAMHSVYASVRLASMSIISDLNNNSQASTESLSRMTNAIIGDLFFWIVGISVFINLAIFTIKGMSLGAGFLISICLTVMAGLVITNLNGMAAGSYDGSAPQDSTYGAITDWIESIFLQAGKSPTDLDQLIGYLDSFWCVIELIPSMVVMEAVPGFAAGIGLAATLFSIIIGFYAIADHDARLSAVGLVLSLIGVVDSFFGEAVNTLSKELRYLTKAIAFCSMILIVTDLSCTVL